MESGPQNMVLYLLIFSCVFLAINAALGAGLEINRKEKFANLRQKRKEQAESPEALLAKMRHDRGLTRDGRLKNLNYLLGKMIMQSGLPIGSYMIYPIMVASGAFLGAGTYLFKGIVVFSIMAAIIGLILPLIIIRMIVKRRQNKAAEQLPEALDVIIRSLKAGHPVPVALALVGREMPDPIGSEFGMASDEVSFGGTVSAAIQRMADRVGQEDFGLFAAMIRLQEKTGGNLAELLEGNAATIRSRQRMRLKIRAASSEGRMSALILNAAPIGLFLIIRLMAPDFYGNIGENNILKYSMVGVVIWMIIGNMVMRKMINFKM